MKLDLSRLMDGGQYGVHCARREDAKNFIEYMRLHYPEKCDSWSIYTHWEVYKENTVYYPHFHSPGVQMMYGGLHGYSAALHRIFEYEDLLVCDLNELEIASSDLSLEFLFEGGV